MHTTISGFFLGFYEEESKPSESNAVLSPPLFSLSQFIDALSLVHIVGADTNIKKFQPLVSKWDNLKADGPL